VTAITRARREPFGAWVRLGDDTLVALDHRRADRVLPPVAFAPDHVAAPLEVHVAVTARCPVDCAGCYQSATHDGEHVPLTQLRKTLHDLSAAGVFTVAFGGGEPLLRDDLGALADEARALGLTPVVTTSGFGLTAARARALRSFAQVNVSHDGVGGGYVAVRGFDGVAVAERAIAALRAEGIAVGINHVLTRQNVDGLAATAAHVRSLGARELQLLRYKPAGRAASLDYLARRLTPAQCDALGETLRALAPTLGDGFSVRVDCATRRRWRASASSAARRAGISARCAATERPAVAASTTPPARRASRASAPSWRRRRSPARRARCGRCAGAAARS
jgi:pyruvate-formate lyase-activating enzyme